MKPLLNIVNVYCPSAFDLVDRKEFCWTGTTKRCSECWGGKGGLVMEELKCCPFCGGEAEMHYGIFDDATYVECIECKANSHVFFEKNSAIAAWNRRVEG